MVNALREDVLTLKTRGIVPDDIDALDVSGHSFRRSGCKYLARKGVPLDLIKYMARHSSDAVRGYVEEALEEAPAADQKLLNHLSLQEQIGNLSERTSSMEKLQNELADRLGAIANKNTGGGIDEASVRCMINSYIQPEVILNIATNKIHSTAGNFFSEPPATWSTHCGWRWINSGRLTRVVTSGDDVPIHSTTCEKCAERLPEWYTKHIGRYDFAIVG